MIEELCPFCSYDLNSFGIFLKCNNSDCRSGYFKTLEDSPDKTKIEWFSAGNYNIEVYTNQNNTVSKIVAENSVNWISQKINNNISSLDKVEEKVNNILLLI